MSNSLPPVSHLLALYSKDVQSVMRRLKSGKLQSSAWLNEISHTTARYLYAAEKLNDHTGESAQASLKNWQEHIQGLDLLIVSAKEYDPEWIYTVRALGRASIKSVAEFRARLWGAVERLLNGGADAGFISTFARAIDVELTKAWNEGANSVGVAPDEMAPEDIKELEKIIDNENSYIAGVIESVRADQLKEMTMEALKSKYSARVDIWANRYVDTVNRAMIWFGGKKRLIWKLGKTEEHCDICRRLNGIVAFSSEWQLSGVHPKDPPNPVLSKNNGGCGGWLCDCSLVPTDQRRSVNALKKLEAIKAGG